MEMRFQFKAAKEAKTKADKSPRPISALIKARVVFEDGEYKAQVCCNDNVFSSIGKVEDESITNIPFSKDSYDNKGKTTVFTIHKPGQKHYVVLRSDAHARDFPGADTQYQTMALDWICEGHVHRVKGKLEFKLKQMLYEDASNTY